jgi:uncharacterized MnhB-related membrane protein
MNGALVLLFLLPIVASIALFQRRRLYAIIGMTILSLLLAAVYLLSAAPDVAITEAALGSALVTFVYVLAIRKTGRLVVAAAETPGLLQRDGASMSGLEWDLLTALSQEMGLDLVVRFAPRAEVDDMLRRGEADLGAGGVLEDPGSPVPQSSSFLSTALYDVRSTDAVPVRPTPLPEYFADLAEAVQHQEPIAIRLDLARFLALSRYGLAGYEATRVDGEHRYVFSVSPDRGDIRRRLNDLLRRQRASGALDDLIRRHFS